MYMLCCRKQCSLFEGILTVSNKSLYIYFSTRTQNCTWNINDTNRERRAVCGCHQLILAGHIPGLGGDEEHEDRDLCLVNSIGADRKLPHSCELFNLGPDASRRSCCQCFTQSLTHYNPPGRQAGGIQACKGRVKWGCDVAQGKP